MSEFKKIGINVIMGVVITAITLGDFRYALFAMLGFTILWIMDDFGLFWWAGGRDKAAEEAPHE